MKILKNKIFNRVKMTRYIMEYNDYKEYFLENAKEIQENEYIELEVVPIDNKQDTETEFSIRWKNINNTSEQGEFRNINTSSIWALMSCKWMVEES